MLEHAGGLCDGFSLFYYYYYHHHYHHSPVPRSRQGANQRGKERPAKNEWKKCSVNSNLRCRDMRKWRRTGELSRITGCSRYDVGSEYPIYGKGPGSQDSYDMIR